MLEEARDGTLYCAEIGQYAKAEQKGLAFLLPKLERANVTLVCTSAEPLGNLAAEGKFDAALLAALSIGAVLLPPLRARREDIPALVERFWREIAAAQKARARPRRARPRRCPTAMTALANAYWPGNLDHLQSVVANLALNIGAGDLTPDHVKRLLGESAAANHAVAPEITAALLRPAAARGARGVRADLLRAAARPRAEQHEPRRGAGRARAHPPLSQAEAAQHPLSRRRGEDAGGRAATAADVSAGCRRSDHDASTRMRGGR